MTDDKFIDPISLEIFTDPLLASDGFFYDKIPLQIWIQVNKNNLRSPKTNKPMNEITMRSRWFNEQLIKYRDSLGLNTNIPNEYGIVALERFHLGGREKQFEAVFDDIIDEYLDDDEVSDELLSELRVIYDDLNVENKKKMFYYAMSEDIPGVFEVLIDSNDYEKYLKYLMKNEYIRTLEHILYSGKASYKVETLIQKFFNKLR